MGTNTIKVGLIENSTLLYWIYDAFKDTVLTEFSFFDESINKPTIYNIVLKVVSKQCKHGLLVDENIDFDGKLQWRAVAKEDLDVRIDQEDFTLNPGVAF